MEELAQGHKWRLSCDEKENLYLLELCSEYGIVELKLKGYREGLLARAILRVYDDLVASGPVVVESQVE